MIVRYRVPIGIGIQIDREKRYSHARKLLLTLTSFRVARIYINRTTTQKLHPREMESSNERNSYSFQTRDDRESKG